MEQPQQEQPVQPNVEPPKHEEPVPAATAPDTSSNQGSVTNGTQVHDEQPAQTAEPEQPKTESAKTEEKSPRGESTSDAPVSPTSDEKGGKKKIEQSKSGFLQFFSRKKEADPINAQREKIEKLVKDIKSETDSLVNLIKAYQPTHPDVKSEGSILPSQFESIFKDLAVIYQLCGDHQKTLKRHIKEITNKSAERGQMWKLWNHLMHEIPELRHMIIDSTLIESSLKSIISDPLAGQEQEEFEQLLKNCLYSYVDVQNVITMIVAFGHSKYRSEHPMVTNLIDMISGLKDKSSVSPLKSDSVVQQFEKSRQATEDMRVATEKCDTELNADYKKQFDSHNTASNERTTQITNLEQDQAKNNAEIASINEKTAALQQQLDEMTKQKTQLEATNAQHKKKLEELKKEEKKDQATKSELEEIKTRAENMTTLHESTTKLKSEQDQLTKSYVSSVLGKLNQELDKQIENKKRLESSLSEKQPEDHPQEDKTHIKDNLAKNKDSIEQISRVVEKIKNKLKEEDYDVELVKSIFEKSNVPQQQPQPVAVEEPTSSTTSTTSTTTTPSNTEPQPQPQQS